ncbi:hypothetical protein LOK74_22020 [Brevibacillus humidisoli]|uniref:hypothetical protein n=1 Tax=Brevibacillus humidisoli TaxID=2895522 RepID=UPI001E2CF547|nr:hypothetical protein [Brevibacillus humidisoli]UFJ40654.1 hypothetical protein LOK74_22020 [Brevibacillus humidisoli]
MDTLLIEPGIGIGPIKLGMTEREVKDTLQAFSEKYLKIDRHFSFYSLFKTRYDSDGKVIFVELCCYAKEHFNCLFRDIDVFNTKAEELVEMIDRISRYDRTHWEVGCTYIFPELGLTLWRPSEFKEEDMEAEWFKELRPDIQEDEMRNLYFQTVAVWSELI